jgi:hypothetical protein
MRALGAAGGKASVASKRSTLAGALRARGRQELERFLTDPDPRIRLRAASVVASYSPERVVSESEALPYWSTRCGQCGALSESKFGRTMPWPTLGQILESAIESGSAELDGELRIDGQTVRGHEEGQAGGPTASTPDRCLPRQRS